MGENPFAASGSDAPASTDDHPPAPRSGNLDIQLAAAWLASSLPLSPSEPREKWWEVYGSVVAREGMLSPEASGSAGVAREEALVNGQSPCVALFYADTAAVVRAVALVDPLLLKGPVGVTALVRATAANLTDVVRELLCAGVDPNNSHASVCSGGSPMHTAALKGHVGCVKLLAACGADVNARLPHGGTPLHLAALHGHRQCVAALIRLDGEVNAACEHELRPLHVAVLGGHVNCVVLLMANGANSKFRDARGHEPICYALEKEDVVMGRAIIMFQMCYMSSNILMPRDNFPICGHNMARVYEAFSC